MRKFLMMIMYYYVVAVVALTFVCIAFLPDTMFKEQKGDIHFYHTNEILNGELGDGQFD